MNRKAKWREVSESNLIRVAQIIGPLSAAKSALDRAKELRAQGKIPKFFQTGHGFLVIEELTHD